MSVIPGRHTGVPAVTLCILAGLLAATSAEPVQPVPASPPQESSADAPAVKQWKGTGGEVELKTLSVGCMGGKDSQVAAVAAKLAADAARLGLGNWTVTDKLDASIWLKMGLLAECEALEAFSIEIADVVVITGNSPAGVTLGAQALLEMLAKDKARRVLPRGTLVAAPTAETEEPEAPADTAKAPAAGAPPAAPAIAVAPAFAVPPYLQDLRTNQVTVMWWSANPSYGWVEYGESEKLGKKADTVVEGLRQVNVRRHAVRLPRLAPGTRYWYRSGLRALGSQTASSVQWGAESFSPVYSFTTPSPADARVRCVILCDTHNNATFGPLLALPGVKPFDFSVFNGDCFGDIKREGPCLELLRAYNELVDGASRPPVFVRGNHDLRNWYGPYLRHLFTYPEGHPYFAFTRGPVRFVVLDCGEAVRDAHPMCGDTLDCSSMRVECAAWLDREIASADFRKAKWHILVVHIPLYGDGCSEHSRPHFLPVLAKTKFDLEVNGHIHTSRLMKPGPAGNPHPVVCIGGFCSAVGVFEATATGWNVKVVDTAGKVLVEEQGGQ